MPRPTLANSQRMQERHLAAHRAQQDGRGPVDPVSGMNASAILAADPLAYVRALLDGYGWDPVTTATVAKDGRIRVVGDAAALDGAARDLAMRVPVTVTRRGLLVTPHIWVTVHKRRPRVRARPLAYIDEAVTVALLDSGQVRSTERERCHRHASDQPAPAPVPAAAPPAQEAVPDMPELADVAPGDRLDLTRQGRPVSGTVQATTARTVTVRLQDGTPFRLTAARWYSYLVVRTGAAPAARPPAPTPAPAPRRPDRTRGQRPTPALARAVYWHTARNRPARGRPGTAPAAPPVPDKKNQVDSKISA